MRPRIMVGAVVATLALAGSSIAFGDGAGRPMAAQPVAKEAQPLAKSLGRVQRAVANTAQGKIRCQTLRCVNQALTEVAKAFKTLDRCLGFINVARYNGYVFSNDGGASTFLTTALDEVPPGEPATRVVILEC